MKKAIAQGECQLCGRVQKLPGNLLSNHGYQIKWNVFEGTCPGSRHLPYDLSCQLIENTIPSVEASIWQLKLKIEEIQLRTGPTCWINQYVRGQGRYEWIEVKLAASSGQRADTMILADGTIKELGQVGSYEYDSVDAAARARDARYLVQVLEPRLKQLKSYLAWCQNRVKNWAAKELESV